MIRRVALVCGGSKGIGQACAAALLQAGNEVIVLSRSPDNLVVAADFLYSATGVRPRTVVADVSEPDAAATVIDDIVRQYGRLDILVNNAGGPPPGTFLDHSPAEWQAAFEQSLLSVVEFTRRAVPHMREQAWGRVVNVTSTLAKEPEPNMVLSATLRAGVAAFTRATARQLAADGVTVNNVCPNAVATERALFFAEAAAEKQGLPLESVLSDAAAQLPIQRLARAEEVANVVAFLASDAASYVSGISMMVDGGATRNAF